MNTDALVMTLLRVEIPMTLPSVANLREHWAKKAKRTKAQRLYVKVAMRHGGLNHLTWLANCTAAIMRGEALVCTLTRIGPRKLDSDNLSSAFKATRDAVAFELGVDDGSDAVAWRYAQEKGKAGVRVEIRAAQLLAAQNVGTP